MMKLRKHESLSSKSPRSSGLESRLRQTSLNKHYENENEDCVIIQVSSTNSNGRSSITRRYNSKKRTNDECVLTDAKKKLKILQNEKKPKIVLNKIPTNTNSRRSLKSNSSTSINGSSDTLGKIPKVAEALENAEIDDLRILHRLCFDSDGKAEYLLKNLQSFVGYSTKTPDMETKKNFLAKIDTRRLNRIAKLLDIDSRSVGRDELIFSILSFLRRPNSRRNRNQTNNDITEIESENEKEEEEEGEIADTDEDYTEDDESDRSSSTGSCSSENSEDQSPTEAVVDEILNTVYKHELTKGQLKQALRLVYERYEF